MENASKIENKEEAVSDINFTCIGNHENHPKTDKLTENTDAFKTEKENIEIAKKLIKNNLQMPLSFHIQNFNANKIKISHNKIKNMLQKIREENFPRDDVFLSNIELINIDLGEDENLINLAFCPLKENFINIKKNKKENIVFFHHKISIKRFI